MRKRVLLSFLFIIVISLSFIAAQENSTKINDAYDCLQDKIDERTCDALSLEEKVFSLLSLGDCKSEILAESVNDECWPSGGCNIKLSAQSILALNDFQTDTTDAENWLLEQTAIPSDMVWYLQVDSNDPTTCTITYSDNSYTISIGEDKKIDRGAGPCLSVSSNDYWLKVSSIENLGCYEKEFEVSCDKNFLTTLLFTKSGSSTIHVSETTTSASADGATIEEVNSFCFSTGARCDYEGSLWAALVLNMLDHDVSSFLPYLITMKDDNDGDLPEVFLYLLTDDTEYRTDLLSKQKADKYWRESGDRFYDTALALYPFQYEEPLEKINAKEWLLEEDVQDDDGCWEGNVRNTGFILYSVWPKAIPGRGAPVDGGDENETFDCEENSYYCRSSINCENSQGNILSDYSCPGTYVCCSVVPEQEFCEDIDGTVCSSNEECVGGDTEETSDLYYGETCCIGGTCETSSGGGDEDECELYGGICKSYECEDGEEESLFYSCVSGQKCCVEETAPGPGGKSLWWIWVLLVLIILIVLAIIFKDKLRKLLFRLKPSGKSRSGPRATRGPPGPPPAPLTGGHPSRMPMPGRAFPKRHPKPKLKSQQELDDVLKKLKEMGK